MSWNDGLDDPALAAASDGFIRKTFRPNDLIAAILQRIRTVRLRAVAASRFDRLDRARRPRAMPWRPAARRSRARA